MAPSITAENKARALLESFLTEKQFTTLQIEGYFDVKSYNGRRVYRFYRHSTPIMWRIEPRHRPVFENPSGYRRKLYEGRHYCIHMPGVPWDDYTLACAMLLSCKEGEKVFHRIANW